MLFNSLEFLAFLPIVFLLYWFVFRGRRWQNLLLLVASYVFYGWWDWRFLLLIALTSFSSFGSALLISRCRERRWQRLVGMANVVLNLCILGLIKYYNFFVDNLNALLASMGYSLDWPSMYIILPVGISFYTFQALSYTIDVYQGKLAPTRDPVAFFAYISFFPQLVAGPIERATNLLPQFQHNRSFRYDQAVDGVRQMLWGFVKKVVVADNCAVAVNQIWDSYAEASGSLLLLGALLFTFQIYCDFSGYSDIAIGCARLFGFNLMQNFRFPYFSRSISDFWRRWHSSLMTWFRDYVYIPLGGSRGSRLATVRNTLLVFALSGLWHGANWTFVTWGLYHALLISVYVVLGRNSGRPAPSRLVAVFQVMLTFLLVLVGWVIFRSQSVAQAFDYLRRMCCSGSLFDVASVTMGKQALMWALLVMGFEWFQRNRQHALQLHVTGLWRFSVVRWTFYYALIAIMLFYHGKQSEFIYFQF